MMHRFRLAAILMVLLLSFQAVPAVQHESGTTDRLSLGFDKSDPGNQAFIGIILSQKFYRVLRDGGHSLNSPLV